jgi:hypothetical protein
LGSEVFIAEAKGTKPKCSESLNNSFIINSFRESIISNADRILNLKADAAKIDHQIYSLEHQTLEDYDNACARVRTHMEMNQDRNSALKQKNRLLESMINSPNRSDKVQNYIAYYKKYALSNVEREIQEELSSKRTQESRLR